MLKELKSYFRELIKTREIKLEEACTALKETLTVMQREYNTVTQQKLRTSEENAALKIKLMTAESRIKILEMSNETIVELEEKIKSLESKITESEDINLQLKDKIQEQEADYLSKCMELSAINARLAREKEATEYYKKLSESYQTMPDFKKIVENIAEYKVPDLKEFVDILSKAQELYSPIKEALNELKSIKNGIEDGNRELIARSRELSCRWHHL